MPKELLQRNCKAGCAQSVGEEKKTVNLSGLYICIMAQVPAVELLLHNGVDAKTKTQDDLTILGMINSLFACSLYNFCGAVVTIKDSLQMEILL